MAVTPLRMESPALSVTCPTRTPATSVMALRGPGVNTPGARPSARARTGCARITSGSRASPTIRRRFGRALGSPAIWARMDRRARAMGIRTTYRAKEASAGVPDSRIASRCGRHAAYSSHASPPRLRSLAAAHPPRPGVACTAAAIQPAVRGTARRGKTTTGALAGPTAALRTRGGRTAVRAVWHLPTLPLCGARGPSRPALVLPSPATQRWRPVFRRRQGRPR